MLDEHGEGGLHQLAVERVRVEDHQRARPVEALRHRRRLAQLEPADLVHHRDHRLGQALRDLRHLEPDDRELLVGGREVDEEVQAPALEAVGQLARVVRGEDHQRDIGGLDRAELGHRHLEVREHLEQEGLELRLGLVDLVHQQHHRIVRLDGLEQRPRRQEAVGEEGVVLPGDARRPRRAATARRRSARRCARAGAGCRGAAWRTSTRRAPCPRRAPRSTGGG